MCLRTLNITSFLLLHTSNQTCSAFSKTSAQTHLHPLPRSFFWCLANTRRTTVTRTCINSLCTLSSAHTQTHTNAHTCTNLKIHPERLLCGIQSQCSWLESLSTASDVTSARSVSCSPPPSPPTPFLFPILFHQLSPSFDTSEGVPHMPVTSPLLHQRFLPSSLSRACVSVWNLCTL